jgi:hypothetical protein
LVVATPDALQGFSHDLELNWQSRRRSVGCLAFDPGGDFLGLAQGDKLEIVQSDRPDDWAKGMFGPRGPAFDVQCNPAEPIWAWACGRFVVFTDGPTTNDLLGDVPTARSASSPLPVELSGSDLPLLVHHLVLSGHGRPDLLQDFAPTPLRDAIKRAQPHATLQESVSQLLQVAKAASHQPDPVWLGWVRTVRATDLENAAAQLRRL